MLTFEQAFIILASAMIGSFAETLYRRRPFKWQNLYRGSSCPSCNGAIRGVRLIPVISYIGQGGKCSACGVSISPYYLVTEVSFLIIAVWAMIAIDPPQLYASLGFGWLLFMAARIDTERFILPDALNLAILLLGASLLPFASTSVQMDRLFGAIIGLALFVAIDRVYLKWRGHSGLGRGDAKLIGATGIWVGLTGLPSVILIAAMTGIAAILIGRVRSGQALSSRTRIAFGPSIALASWLVHLYGPIFV